MTERTLVLAVSGSSLARRGSTELATSQQPPVCLHCGRLRRDDEPHCTACTCPAGGWELATGQPTNELARGVRTAGSLAWFLGGGVMVLWAIARSGATTSMRMPFVLGGLLLAGYGLLRAWDNARVRSFTGPGNSPFASHQLTLSGGAPLHGHGASVVLHPVLTAPMASLSSATAFAKWDRLKGHVRSRVRGSRSLNDTQLAMTAALANLLHDGAIELFVLGTLAWSWRAGKYRRSPTTLQRILLARAPHRDTPPEGWLEGRLWAALPERHGHFQAAGEGAAPYRDAQAVLSEKPLRECFRTLSGCIASAMPGRGKARKWLRATLSAEAGRKLFDDLAEKDYIEALTQLAAWQFEGASFAHLIAQETGWALKQRAATLPLPHNAAALLEQR